MEERTRNRRFLMLAGLLFLAYALPLFWPPAPLPPAPPTLDAGLLGRVFPGVPPNWVAIRLGCLLAATLLAGAAVGPGPPLRWPTRREAGRPTARGILFAALCVAVLHATVGLAVDSLGRGAQSVYFACFAVPAGMLWLSERKSPTPRVADERRARIAGWLVLAVWLVSRVPDLVWPSRAADPVDTWLSHEWIERAAFDGRNLLTQGFLPGLTCIYMFLQGVSVLGPGGVSPDFAWLQKLHVFWCLVTGALVGSLSAKLTSPWAAPVAMAAFLFSPFVLLQPLVPAPYVFGPLYTSGLALLLFQVHERRSPAALAALGALAGIAATSHPPLAPVAGLALGAGLLSALRAPSFPRIALAVPIFSLLAAAIPAFPDLDTLSAMRDEFTRSRGQWAGLEAVLLGQRDPYEIPALWRAGRPGGFDIAVASLLSPFAIARTSLRAWGDTLFDPVAAGLTALGILLTLRAARRDLAARAVLLLLAIGVAPALASSYDRPSHTRLFVAQVPLAVLAAYAFDVLRRSLLPAVSPLPPAFAVVGAMAAGGILLFDVVNPRILAASSLGITTRALGGDVPPGGAALLVFPGPDDLSWLHEERIIRAVAPASMRVLPFAGPNSLSASAAPDRPVAELLFFSPGLEQRLGVSRAICARWPSAALYEFTDEAGLSRTFAARPAGPGFFPASPPAHVRVLRCGEPFRAPLGGAAEATATPRA